MAISFERKILDEFAFISGGAFSSGSISSASSGGGAASAFSTLFRSGFGLSPVIGAIISLFGGGRPDEPEPLVKYHLPASLDLQRTQAASRTYESDYDQAGNARTIGESASGSGMGMAGQHVTVNIQAMDARSFLDRSNDIAAAVRDAMLNLSSLNDVIADL